MGCHALLQGIFPTQRLNLRLLGRQFFFFFYHYCHLGNPSIDTAAAAAAKSLQSCLTLWDPMDCSLPDFSVPGILQARTLEWVAISFSNA